MIHALYQVNCFQPAHEPDLVKTTLNQCLRRIATRRALVRLQSDRSATTRNEKGWGLVVPVMWRMGMDEPVSVFAALSVIMGWYVWRGGVIALRLGELEVIVRRWRRRW